jgi:hypothetical protein
LKSWQLNRRVSDLSEKLEPVQSDVVRLDFDSFTEPEKQLFRKIWEIQEKYGDSPPADVIEANKEFIFKATEVISWRVLELFMFVNRELLGEDEIEEWYFKLHFYNFFEDLKECLQRVRNWSKKDREYHKTKDPWQSRKSSATRASEARKSTSTSSKRYS